MTGRGRRVFGSRQAGWAALLLLSLVLWSSEGRAQEAGNAPSTPSSDSPREITDNSFLVEEAYNQEDGFVQHINMLTRSNGGEWAYSFTEEWPASGLAHQLSYSIPVVRAEDTGDRTLLGDIVLNYRYQLAGGLEGPFSCSPRLTAILPTGDASKGSGTGGLGLQALIPVSFRIGDRLAVHANLGATFTRHARTPEGRHDALWSYNAGASLVFFASHDANLMLEAVWTRGPSFSTHGAKEWSDQILLSPGLRWAFDFESELQIVPGIGFPIGIGRSRGDRSVLLYLSFEHLFGTRSAAPGPPANRN